MTASTVELMTDEIRSDVGTIVIAARDGRLCGLDYDDGRPRLMALLAARYGGVRLRPIRDPFGFGGRIGAYLAGQLEAVDGIPVETGGTTFQQRVWEALRRIPVGTTLAYADLARALGRGTAPRAVGAANARNPVAIVIPCHRLIGTDSSLTGYAGGLWRKRWLLRHEGALPPDRPAGAHRPR